MKLSTVEDFIKVNDELWSKPSFTHKESKFPYTAVVEGHYPEGDFAHRWCWQKFDSPDCEKCYDHHSEYPGCPNVLAIEEYVIKKSYVRDGVEHFYDFHTRDPGEHGHIGIWNVIWLGKTDYDYGFTQFCFQNEVDRDLFVKEAPNFGLGENYED